MRAQGTAAARSVRYTGWEDPSVGAGLFLATFVLGGASILTAKIMQAPPAFSILMPAVAITLYAACVKVPRLRLRYDQVGDNAYYLGFLFTLVSLAWALYAFDADAGANAIVRNFGVAVSSTIWGVAARVLLNLMHRSATDVEETARMALADATRNLREEIAAATEAFAEHRRLSQQSAAEEIRALRDVALEQLKDTSQTVDKAVKAATGRIEKVTLRWGDTAETFNDKSDQLVAAMSTLASRLEAVRSPSMIVEEKLAEAGRAVADLAASTSGAIAGLAGALDRVEGGATAIEQAAAGARDLLVVSLEQSTALQEANEILSAAKAHLDQLQSSSASFQSTMSRDSSGVVAGLGHLVDRLETLINQRVNDQPSRMTL